MRQRMRRGRRRFNSAFCASAVAAIVTGLGVAVPAEAQSRFQPVPFSLQQNYDYESVYAPPEPKREDEGVNEGGVHVDLTVAYLTDYVFRGFDRSESLKETDPLGGLTRGLSPSGREDSPNLQFDGKLSFDLGKAPHPFIGVFVNVFNSDPISRFQEIRPFFGAEWTIRPLILTAGHNTYLFPDRDPFNTSEVFAKLALDDSYFFRTDKPVFSPYIYSAYDYDLYDGIYVEAGVEHDFELEDFGIILTAYAHVAYVHSNPQYVAFDVEENSGFQHYQFGLTGSYVLNPLLHIPPRYGEWRIEGYLAYTDGIDPDLRADTQLWGGGAIGFRY